MLFRRPRLPDFRLSTPSLSQLQQPPSPHGPGRLPHLIQPSARASSGSFTAGARRDPAALLAARTTRSDSSRTGG